MIIKLKKNTEPDILDKMTKQLNAFQIKQEDFDLLITSSGLKEVPASFEKNIEEQWGFRIRHAIVISIIQQQQNRN